MQRVVIQPSNCAYQYQEHFYLPLWIDNQENMNFVTLTHSMINNNVSNLDSSDYTEDIYSSIHIQEIPEPIHY